MPVRSLFMLFSRLCFALVLAAPLILAVGCGDDENPADNGNGDGDTTTVEIGRGTIDSLLSLFFPEAYSNHDSIKYEETLDERYSFQKLPHDPDDPIEELFWDKAEELRIAGRMFRGTANGAGQSVESITLNINVGATTPSFDTDQPDDEEWFDIVAIIDMTVVLNDPNQSDGTGILNLLIDSEQKFIVTAEDDGAGDWVIVKQEDQQRINKGPKPGAPNTAGSAWSGLKSLFR